MVWAAFARLSIEEYVATPHRGLACLYFAEFLVLLIRSAARHISLEYTGVYFDMFFLIMLCSGGFIHYIISKLHIARTAFESRDTQATWTCKRSSVSSRTAYIYP